MEGCITTKLKIGLSFGIIFLFILSAVVPMVFGDNVEQTSYPLNSREIAWWEFNEGSGNTAYDSSGHGYDGTVYGATWTADGLSFDGMDNYVDFDVHATALGMNKTDDITVIVRFRTTGSGMLFSMSHTNPERAYFDMQIDGDGKVGVITGDVTCTFDLFTTASYDDGDWHVLKCEFLGDKTNPTMNLYIDGDFDATTTEWLCPMIDEDFITAKVGRNSNTESDYFDGEIDDIKIYKNDMGPPPPWPPTINGPSHGKPGQRLTYTFNAEDPDGDDVRFHIDWGDGNEEWTIYVASETDKAVSHIWDVEDTYTITAFSEDEVGTKSSLATFTVIIPRDKATNNMLFWRLIEQFPILQKLFLLLN